MKERKTEILRKRGSVSVCERERERFSKRGRGRDGERKRNSEKDFFKRGREGD